MYLPRTSAFKKCHRIGKKLLHCVALTVLPRSFTFLERKTIYMLRKKYNRVKNKTIFLSNRISGMENMGIKYV